VKSSAHSEGTQGGGQPGALRALGAPLCTLRSAFWPSPGHGTGKNAQLPMSARATNFQPHAFILQARKLVSPLECTDTKNAPASPLECMDTNSLDLKSFRFHAYKNRVGGWCHGRVHEWKSSTLSRLRVVPQFGQWRQHPDGEKIDIEFDQCSILWPICAHFPGPRFLKCGRRCNSLGGL